MHGAQVTRSRVGGGAIGTPRQNERQRYCAACEQEQQQTPDDDEKLRPENVDILSALA